MRPLIVSYYNKDDESAGRELALSCEKFGLEHYFEAQSVSKPEFLLNCLEKFQRPLIWTEIDSVFVQEPTLLLECKSDTAIRINDQVSFDSPLKMLTSTLFFNNTASAKKLLSFWKRECEKATAKDPAALDQVALRKVILHYPTIVEIKRLPLSYVATAENSEGVIVFHHSREPATV